MSERLGKLLSMLEKQPRDAFLLYGVAMEYKKAGKVGEAMEYLNKTLEVDPGYCYAYFQQGQVEEMKGDIEGAKRAYRAGLVAAEKVGDGHARSEIEGALQMIE